MVVDESLSDRAPSSGSTSRSLLAGAKRAAPQAWERLVRLYAPLVASWCRRRGVAEQDVVDVLQDVFSAVASHLDGFRKEQPTDTFRGWLSVIARNKVHDYFRRRADHPQATGGSEALERFLQVQDPYVLDEPSDAQDMFLDDVLRRALALIQGEFREPTWQAFWGVVIEGRTAADVADQLGMKPGAVRVAKSRVLLRLRRELGDVPDERG